MRESATEPLEERLRLRARLVVATLFGRWTRELSVGDDADGWLKQVGALRVASAVYAFPLTLAAALPRERLGAGPTQQLDSAGRTLVAFAGAVVPVLGSLREHYAVWSKRVVVSCGGFAPTAAMTRALGAHTAYSKAGVLSFLRLSLSLSREEFISSAYVAAVGLSRAGHRGFASPRETLFRERERERDLFFLRFLKAPGAPRRRRRSGTTERTCDCSRGCPQPPAKPSTPR